MLALAGCDCAGFGTSTPPTIVVTAPDDLRTTEGGKQLQLGVALSAEPDEAVTVPLVSSNPAEATVSPATLTFTPENWKAPQAVTVTGVDDDVADGNQTFTVDFGPSTSKDESFAGLKASSVELSNVDDDSAGIFVSAASGATREAGDQATFTVALTSQPTAAVTLTLESDDPSEGTISPATLTFTPANWNAPQTVAVTGVDDDLADGTVSYTVAFRTISSADARYQALVLPRPVALENVDDETAGFTVVGPSGPTGENGDQATFTVVLNSEPFADVTVHFASSDETEGTLTATSLTFTPTNWKAPQTVTVTGQNDDLADGNQPYAIVFSETTSSDEAYAALTPKSVALTNTDDDSAGIAVSAISGNTTEAGGQATFAVRLTSQPYADVTVHFASNDESEGTLTTNALTFTDANWNAPQIVTVTGVDDFLADGNQPYAIAFDVTTSSDEAYAALTPKNVDVSNTDDDSAGITVSAVSGNTTEEGGQATFTIRLTSQPFANVTVQFASSDESEGTLSTTWLTFTDQNWNAPQTVTVTGVDDQLADGNQPYAITFSATTSSDAAYAAITPLNVSVTNIDNDSAGFLVSAVSGNTTEGGGQATFTIRLTSQPFADVTVNFASNDETEGTLSTTSLTFTPANWRKPQTVTVTGVDDFLADGNQPYAIVFSATTTTDAGYAALKPGNVNLTTTDDDSAGFVVSEISDDTTELGGTATFTIRLQSQPLADVAVHPVSGDTTEGTVSPGTLTFTPANWNEDQTVTVTGVDDNLVDGTITYAINWGPTTSSDATYAALTPSSVTVRNIDYECGDGRVDAGEESDPPPGPFSSVRVNATTCRWEFAQVRQLYCNGNCSWAGGGGCDQADADILCKLKTGNPNSRATSWTHTTALDVPGFSCPGYGTPMDPLPARGVYVAVWYQDSSILENHGAGEVVADPVCTNP